MRYTKRVTQYIAAALVSVMIGIPHSYADIRCLKISRQKGKITSRILKSSRAKCPKGSGLLLDLKLLVGSQGIPGVNGINGASGANGSNGEDAKEAVWGDGSAGDLIVNSSTTLQTRNPQFRDITINSGSILSVASGSTLRATGTCKINVNGKIDVLKGALPAAHSNTSTTYAARERLANYGLASNPPGSGELGEYIIGVGANELTGGAGGVGMSAESARKLVRLTEVSYGSGGGAGLSVLAGGGGGFALYCKGAIIIQGTIVADGGSASLGGGGGSGGLVVIASKSSIVSSGTLSAKGGTGASFLLDSSAGGGGGGGVIHLIAPHIIPGTIDVSGGSGGAAGFMASGLGVRAGSGGGAFGGNGGRGAHVGDGFGNAISGSSGHSLQTTVDDPATLLL